ncbi:prepilin-type N-terminal cleavage/methylation domain-containing protein [Bacillus andreraoultii]|uniref:prepilin-type N-terminal cleavage/methylation domain-containing protein n=1 Tax=Bacillus andreraoultii TaxID=1499685 RepID=UPI00053BB089|nr:prepilin-type N-terminal cleavage/methylation domain-containing protein [Bacillus andreraoultii]
MQKHLKQLKNEKGMTLVEILAVLVILALIAAIAIPMIGNIISDSQKKSELNDALNIIAAAKLADANGEALETISTGNEGYKKDTLITKGYLDSSVTNFTGVKKSDSQWELIGFTFTKATGTPLTEAGIKSALKTLN